MPELPWIAEARKHIGQKEIPGTKNNPFIVGIWPAIGVSWFDSELTPWCAGFIAYCLKKTGFKILGPATVARALAWADYGVKLDRPAYGAIAVKSRKGGGHVGFVVGKDQFGNIMLLGGNQGDSVKIAPFKASEISHYRWPSIKPGEHRYDLPLLTSDGRMVTEA